MELAMQSPTVVEGVGILGQQVRGLSSCFQEVLAPHGVEGRDSAGVDDPEGVALCFLAAWVLMARPWTCALNCCRHLGTALVDSAQRPTPSSSL